MLQLSMASMYSNAMNQAVKEDFEKAVFDYYAKAINMYKSCQAAYKSRDHYRAEGLKQHAFVKQLLAEQAPLQATIRELEHQLLQVAKESLLNQRELYEIATDEASKAVKAQQAIEQFSKQMEEELHPLRMRVHKEEAVLQDKAKAYDTLMQTYGELQTDHATVTALL